MSTLQTPPESPSLTSPELAAPTESAPTEAKVTKPRVRKPKAPKPETVVDETPVAPVADETPVEPVVDESEEVEFSPAQLWIEDFVVTSLLSAGRPLRGGELAARAEDWTLPRAALREALQKSTRVGIDGRSFDCAWRLARKGQNRELRARPSLESLIRELLLSVGKPLPAAVIAREVALMRNIEDPNIKGAVAGVLKTLRFAIEITPGVYIHENWLLKVGAPSDAHMIRENSLETDADFQGLLDFAEVSATQPAAIARELMEFTGGPLTQKVIGFFVHRANPQAFSARELAGILNDRTQFQPLVGGFITLKDQLAELKTQTGEWLNELAGPREDVDSEEMLQETVAHSEAFVPRPEELAEIKRLARGASNGDGAEGETYDVARLAFDFYELEPGDALVAATIQGLNEALRRDADWLPSGVGRFMLRENIPAGIGEIPEELLPVTLDLQDSNGQRIEVELEDEGLDGDSANWIHAPEWEDVGEEHEVISAFKVSNRQTKLVMLSHHLRAGTLKLRRVDEELWDLSGPVARVILTERDGGEEHTLWASKESGLLYGLYQWCEENLPASGGTILVEREGQTLFISPGTPDAATFLTERRVDELEDLRAAAHRISLVELITRIMAAHRSGLEIGALWAQVNVVRRTSKRLLASVLSANGEFVCKQRGPNSNVWSVEKDGESGFKESKRRFLKA
jgi:hypothetical protein